MATHLTAAADGPVANLYAWVVSVMAAGLAIGSVALGWTLVWSPQRYAGVSWRYITNGTVTWSTAWGLTLIACGAVALFGQYTHRRWPTRIAHCLSAFGCCYWVIAFYLAVRGSEVSAPSGCVAYAVIGFNHVLAAVASPHRPHRLR